MWGLPASQAGSPKPRKARLQPPGPLLFSATIQGFAIIPFFLVITLLTSL